MSPCEPFHTGCNGLRVSYLANMLCENSSAAFAEGYDYIIINCGHHPAAAEHFTYADYTSKVKEFIGNFKQIQKTRLFWLENTAPPIRQDHWVIEKKDWRTYHRLVLFNTIAMHEARGLNASLTVLPAFRSTLALFDKMCDCAHYSISAKLPQMFAFLNSMRLFL